MHSVNEIAQAAYSGAAFVPRTLSVASSGEVTPQPQVRLLLCPKPLLPGQLQEVETSQWPSRENSSVFGLVVESPGPSTGTRTPTEDGRQLPALGASAPLLSGFYTPVCPPPRALPSRQGSFELPATPVPEAAAAQTVRFAAKTGPKRNAAAAAAAAARRLTVRRTPEALAREVLRAVRERTSEEASGVSPRLGWEVLGEIWGVSEADLDAASVAALAARPWKFQTQVLLSLAAIDLQRVKNLSAYLNSIVKEHETFGQVCLCFLSGLCQHPGCSFVHPTGTTGWEELRIRWGITYDQLDYSALNFLCKQTPEDQEQVLVSLAAMDLREVANVSAWMSRLTRTHDTVPQRRLQAQLARSNQE